MIESSVESDLVRCCRGDRGGCLQERFITEVILKEWSLEFINIGVSITSGYRVR